MNSRDVIASFSKLNSTATPLTFLVALLFCGDFELLLDLRYFALVFYKRCEEDRLAFLASLVLFISALVY